MTDTVDNSRLFLRRGAVTLAGKLALGGSKAFAIWILARELGPTVQGAFSLAISGMSVGALVFSLGLEYANTYVPASKRETLPAVLGNSLLWVVIILFLSPVWGWFYQALFPQALHGVGDRYFAGILILGGAAVISTLNHMLRAITIALEAYADMALANALWGATWIIGVLIGIHYSYVSILAIWTLSVFVSIVYYMWRILPQVHMLRLDAAVFKEQFRYGIRTVPGSLARALNLRFALYVVAFFLSTDDVGVFAILLAIGETFLYLPNALSQVVFGSSATNRYSVRDEALGYALIVLLGAVSVACAWLAGEEILTVVFGDAYVVGASALPIVLAASTIHSLGIVKLHEILGEGDPWAATLAQVIALVGTVLAGVLLIPRWGLVGAASTNFLAYALFTVFLFWRYSTVEATLHGLA